MDSDLGHVRIAIALHSLVAIAMGWVSVIAAGFYGDAISILIGMIVLWALGRATKNIIGNKGSKWWFSNGVVIYLFVWLISWIMFFNIMLPAI